MREKKKKIRFVFSIFKLFIIACHRHIYHEKNEIPTSCNIIKEFGGRIEKKNMNGTRGQRGRIKNIKNVLHRERLFGVAS